MSLVLFLLWYYRSLKISIILFFQFSYKVGEEVSMKNVRNLEDSLAANLETLRALSLKHGWVFWRHI
jgi:hypothetical protein